MDNNHKILASAQKLFSAHGLKKVTTDDIAREAHVSKATIYKLYRNKQEILKDVVRLEMEELLTEIREAVAAQTSVEDRLGAHLQTKIAKVHHLINLHRVTRATMAEYWEEAEVLRKKFMLEESNILQGILDEGRKSGEFEVENVAATALFMVVSLQSLEYPWSVEGLNMTVQDQVDCMLDILLRGLRKRN